MRVGGGTALAALLVLAGCGSDATSKTVRETAENVLTLQRGTVSALRDRRGSGPFRLAEVPPAAMPDVLAAAMRRARAGGGRGEGPVPVEVYVSRRYGEVLAKEGAREGAEYADPFRSAALAIVHPAPGRPDACRVEVHATDRGPAHRGRVDWDRRLWGFIDEALAELGRSPTRPVE